MQTAIELLSQRLEELRELSKEFLLNHVRITRWNYPNRGDNVVYVGGDFSYSDLDEPGLQLQAEIREKIKSFLPLVRLLLTRHNERQGLTAATSVEKKFEEITRKGGTTYSSNGQQAFERLNERLDKLQGFLAQVYGIRSDEILLIPDTNALYHNPDITSWAFDEFKQFTLVLVPAILRELDDHKVSHRAESVRGKAQKLIRMIKEFGRRGDLNKGVDIRKGVSKIRAVAVEPDMKNTLEWLSSDVADDRMIATTLEMMWTHPRSTVAIVTADINVQNKARFASLPFLEPPATEEEKE